MDYNFFYDPTRPDTGHGIWRPLSCKAPDFNSPPKPTNIFADYPAVPSGRRLSAPSVNALVNVRPIGSQAFGYNALHSWETSRPTVLLSATAARVFGGGVGTHTLIGTQVANIPLRQPLWSESVARLAARTLTSATYLSAAPIKTAIVSINATNLILTKIVDCNTVCIVDDALGDQVYYQGIGCWGVNAFFERFWDGDFC